MSHKHVSSLLSPRRPAESLVLFEESVSLSPPGSENRAYGGSSVKHKWFSEHTRKEKLMKADSSFTSPLLDSRNFLVEETARTQLAHLLRSYIVFRCSLFSFCCEEDFDTAAVDALTRLPFLQALQTVEHFSSSVSARIKKKSAYLMGILRGQEVHWDKFSANSSVFGVVTGRQVLTIPNELLVFIGQVCLRGNCAPSDFNPEVCLNLHSLTLALAFKSISAFNSNKRIAAGPKGGILNRARFFLGLIQNVSEQCTSNLSQTGSIGKHSESHENLGFGVGLLSNPLTPKSFGEQAKGNEFNLEELADISYNQPNRRQGIAYLEHQLEIKNEREMQLMIELEETKRRLRSAQTECAQLRSLLNFN